MGLIYRLNVYIKALIFGTYKQPVNIFQNEHYQSHSMNAIGLKSGKKSIKLGLCGYFIDLKVTLKLKLHTSNFSQTNI